MVFTSFSMASKIPPPTDSEFIVHLYGDSVILTECIFSQPAPGSVSSAYFCKLVHFSACGVQFFANTRGVFANF